MHLWWLIFVSVGLPWVGFGQVTEDDVPTTHSAGHRPQANTALSKVNSSYQESLSGASEEQRTTMERSQSYVSEDIPATLTSPEDSSDDSNSGEENHTPFTTSAGDLGDTTRTQTSGPSEEWIADGNDWVRNDSDLIPQTSQTPRSHHTFPQETITAHTAKQSHQMLVTTSASGDRVFDDFISLTTENVSLCFQGKGSPLHFNSAAGQLNISFSLVKLTDVCAIEFMVPPGKAMKTFYSVNTKPDKAFKTSLISMPSGSKVVLASSTGMTITVFPGNSIRLELTCLRKDANITVFFNFTAVPHPELVQFNTNTTGYVYSPYWNGNTAYPQDLDTEWRLEVPPRSSVMLSFLAMDLGRNENCAYDCLSIYKERRDSAGGDESEKLVYRNDPLSYKPYHIFNTSALRFHFTTNSGLGNLGFKLYFSIHDQHETPHKLEDGKWNCSVPFGAKLMPHFDCNLVEECSGGEDEESCSYTRDRCGRGHLSIGSRCYVFVPVNNFITWSQAEEECLHRGSYLASLNSRTEWWNVIHVVRQRLVEPVYFGLRSSGADFPHLYRSGFRWADGSLALYFLTVKTASSLIVNQSDICFYLRRSNRYPKGLLTYGDCSQLWANSFLCELNQTNGNTEKQGIDIPPLQWQHNDTQYIVCPAGHVTMTFLARDPQSACLPSQPDSSTPVSDYSSDTPPPPPPRLQCLDGKGHVPYTLVCDQHPDCSDRSDENLCAFPSCSPTEFQCRTSKQCLPLEKRCDQKTDCPDSSDEWYTECNWIRNMRTTNYPPAVVWFDGWGYYNFSGVRFPPGCAKGYFRCPGTPIYCMPVYLRCNGVHDCPGREDEEGCDRYQCPGFYRCRGSSVCLYPSQLCDRIAQCPQYDDELFCGETCPQNCTCYGLAFYCHGQFPADQYPKLRFLHAAESGLTPRGLTLNPMLIYLSLAKCRLKDFNHVNFLNLRILDLSDNEISSLSTKQLQNVPNLQKLSIARNPLKSLFGAQQNFYRQFPLFQTLDMSNVIMSELNTTTLQIFPKLEFLNLSGCGIKRLAGDGFHSFSLMKNLDTRNCPVTDFPPDMFKGLRDLTEVWADNYKLCCPQILPRCFGLPVCHSPSDEISSCDALLRSDVYRAILSVIATLALTGNMATFLYRVLVNRESNNLGFDVFVSHLCVSDFLMGVYLAVIGIADQIYKGNYIWKDDAWKHSAGCKLAGFLSFLSSEVSAFIICLITLDRCLVLRFPFSNARFKNKSAHAACAAAWLTGGVLAGIPLLPATAHWNFYSQNGICIPLPITRMEFAGHNYSFSVIIILNLVLFLLIAAGQAFIYRSVRSNSMAAESCHGKSNDLTLARRLLTVAMSDFLCWFPIGLLGLLASCGVAIPGEINVAMAIVVLPINSAINPFLYTLNMLMERRRARKLRTRKMTMSTVVSQHSKSVAGRLSDSCSQAEALQWINEWLSHSVITPTHLEQIFQEREERMSE